jgi:hypothetical protein
MWLDQRKRPPQIQSDQPISTQTNLKPTFTTQPKIPSEPPLTFFLSFLLSPLFIHDDDKKCSHIRRRVCVCVRICKASEQCEVGPPHPSMPERTRGLPRKKREKKNFLKEMKLCSLGAAPHPRSLRPALPVWGGRNYI